MNENFSLTLKEWADEDKPREKMLSKGKKELSNAELIAILLRSGLQGKSAVDVAKEVLALSGNSLATMAQMEFKQLSSVKGLGSAKCTTLMAALELGWRLQSEINLNKDTVLSNSADFFHFMAPLIADIDHEEFWAVYLSNRNKVIGKQRVTTGGITGVTVDPRILFRGAIECKAVRVMVAHNHPSGNLRPSAEDRKLTQRIAEAGRLLDIQLLDHLIVALTPEGKADYYSFRDNGYL